MVASEGSLDVDASNFSTDSAVHAVGSRGEGGMTQRRDRGFRKFWMRILLFIVVFGVLCRVLFSSEAPLCRHEQHWPWQSHQQHDSNKARH